jgi:NAD(P)-dependent dehydrogenase (short-subunit alcohol dehydrogenase family)
MIGAYSAAKAAVILLTQAMALEWGSSGISVNAVCPGTVDTDLINLGGALNDQLKEQIARNIPLGRIQSADEIAATICWLLSDDAAAVTGEAVNASAGETMV